jgi:serine/threonine protein kinase
MTNASTLHCASCGGILLAADRFCGTCGTPAPGVDAAVELSIPERMKTPAGSPWASVLRELTEGTVGEFEIKRELGHGGMAAVYLAHEIALNRKVALKVMAPGIMVGEGMVDRFRMEAITVANLSHPHIVRVHAVKQAGELYYIVMQYIAGRTLERVLRETGPLPIPVIRVILAQVGSALHYAHRRGVIHRDIKPGNVMLDAGGDAVVTDFGIAKVTTATTQTLTGGVVGTPPYMSPEQCYAYPLTGASDQYSLGIVAYEMLTGGVPFTGATYTIMQGHTQGEVPSLAHRRPDCPPDLEQIVMRMLAKQAGDRFASLAEAVAAVAAPAVGEHDPLRAELIALAAPEENAALDTLVPTPLSPVPQSRSMPRVATAPMSQASSSPSASSTPPFSAPANASGRTIVEPDVLTPSRGVPVPGARRRPWVWAVPGAIGTIAAIVLAIVLTRPKTPDAAGQQPPNPPRGPDTTSGPAAPVRSTLRVADVPLTVAVGDTFTLTAIFNGHDSLAAVANAWQSRPSGVVRIDAASGRARALAEGIATVAVARNGLRDSVTLRVLPASTPAVRGTLVIRPPTGAVHASERVTLRAELDVDGRARPIAAPVTWASSDPAIATIDRRTGDLLAVAAGRTTITARTADGQSALTIVVDPAPRTPPPVRDSLPAPRIPDPSPAAPPAVRTKTVAELRAEIETIIRNYARAIEARDIARMRMLNPGISPEQASGFADFFANASNIKITITSIDTPAQISALPGAETTARVRYKIQYTTRRVPYDDDTAWQASLERTATGWKVRSIR